MQLKNFILRFFLTILMPIVILGSCYEILFRNIPNTHQYKKAYMEQHAEDIEVLILGNSHAFDGVNPNYLDYNGFNLAYHSQEFIFDYLWMEKYIHRMKNLKCLVLPMSYFTLFEEDIHEWRANKYRLYAGIDNGVKLGYKLECFKKDNFAFLKDYLLYGKDLVICDSLGNANSYETFSYYDWEKSGINAAHRHSLYSGKITNDYLLDKIIKLSKKYGVKILFVTYPAWKSYYENLNPTQWDVVQETIDSLTNQNTNIFYSNFINDSSFVQDDFMNVDHLNFKGSLKMSKKLNLVLNSLL